MAMASVTMAFTKATFVSGNYSTELLQGGSGPGSVHQLVSLPRLSSYPTVVCGRGDKRTAKGKRFRHSYGNCRPRKRNKGRGLSPTPLPPKPVTEETGGGEPEPVPTGINLGE